MMNVVVVSPIFSKVAKFAISKMPHGGSCLIIFDDIFIDFSVHSIEGFLSLPYEEVLNMIRNVVNVPQQNRYVYFCYYDVYLDKVFFVTKQDNGSLFICKTNDL